MAAPVGAQDNGYRQIEKVRTDPVLQAELQQILKSGLRRAFGEASAPGTPPSDFFQKPLPVFVTLKKGETIRGCIGSLYPRNKNLADEISQNLEWALFRDPRHRAVRRDELPGMEVFLTAVGTPIPVKGIAAISPGRDGAYLRQGNKEAVVLPGEAKTQRYLLALLKAKAGIKRGEPFQLFRLPSISISAFTVPG